MVCPYCEEELLGIEDECPACSSPLSEEEKYDVWDEHGFASARAFWAWKEG